MLVTGSADRDIQNSRILRGISLKVAAASVCLIGRNGAGKTTTFRTIRGYLTPFAGTVALKDRSIVGLPTHAICAARHRLCARESQVFGDLNVARTSSCRRWTRPQGRDAKTRIAMAYEFFPKRVPMPRARQPAIRGRAQDGFDRACADARWPSSAAARRAVRRLSRRHSSISEGIASIRRLGRGILMAESNIHHIPEYADSLMSGSAARSSLRGRPQSARVARCDEYHQRRRVTPHEVAMQKILSDRRSNSFARRLCIPDTCDVGSRSVRDPQQARRA